MEEAGRSAGICPARGGAVKGTDKVIEWHFAEEQIAEFFRRQFARAGYDHIVVVHTPLQKVFDICDLARLI